MATDQTKLVDGVYLCNCGKPSFWLYMPSSADKRNPFYCDDCVPRGCSCNQYHLNESDFDSRPKADEKVKWIEENKIWVRLDEKDRQYPCVEFDYEEGGYTTLTFADENK